MSSLAQRLLLALSEESDDEAPPPEVSVKVGDTVTVGDSSAKVTGVNPDKGTMDVEFEDGTTQTVDLPSSTDAQSELSNNYIADKDANPETDLG